MIWRQQIQRQRESRNRKRIEQLQELQQQSYKERVTKEREK